MQWLETRNWLVGLIAICSLLGYGCQKQTDPRRPLGQLEAGISDGERADGRPRWKMVRTLSVGPVWSASPDGKYIATIDDQRLRITTALAGPVLHHVAIPITAHDLIVTKSAVICFKRLDPAATEVAVLDIKSGSWKRFDTSASIWQMTPDASGDGIWMSCGDHSVRHYPNVLSGPIGMTKLEIPGYGGTLSAHPKGCIVSEVLPSGVTAVSNDTTIRWHIDEENPKRVSRVLTTQSGPVFLDSTERSKPDDHTITKISGSTGAPIWEVRHSAKIVSVGVDQKSGMLAVSVGIQGARIPAKLFVYDATGLPVIDGRGSGYFSPTLVGITESGHRITVIDGNRGLTTLSDNGSTLARRIQMPGVPMVNHGSQLSRISIDDHFLFIQTSANNIQILEALHGE